ncbi:metallophosphoesterase [Rhodobacteraceae bacterium F11138]|nr:metallophosphoesterase [Rhodobacteraceae bacterium F11138]
MTRFLHLTDLHLSHPDLQDPHLNSDTRSTVAQVLGRLRSLDPAPEFVVLSGDLTNHGDAASYGMLRDMLSDLPMPVVPALGNHDTRAGFRAVFDGFGADADAALFHHRALAGVHVIALDSLIPGQVSGGIGPDQFAALETALQTHADLPRVLVCHHPPHSAGMMAWEGLNAEDSDRLGAILQGQNVVAMLSGHVHMNRVRIWCGIPVVVNMGLHATVDVLEPGDMVIQEGTGFADCNLDGRGLQVTFVPHAPQGQTLGRIEAEKLRQFP